MRPKCLPLIFALMAGAMLARTAGAQQAPDPDRCRNEPEWRQLDFWIGTWDVVHPEDGRRLGVNVIEPMLNGCALMESWTAAGGGTGRSLNFYDPQRRTWRQVWVDAVGNVLDYRHGELRDGAMRFRGITIGPAGDTTLQKLTFTTSPRTRCGRCSNPRRMAARRGAWTGRGSTSGARMARAGSSDGCARPRGSRP